MSREEHDSLMGMLKGDLQDYRLAKMILPQYNKYWVLKLLSDILEDCDDSTRLSVGILQLRIQKNKYWKRHL